jgi:hypothetical protein
MTNATLEEVVTQLNELSELQNTLTQCSIDLSNSIDGLYRVIANVEPEEEMFDNEEDLFDNINDEEDENNDNDISADELLEEIIGKHNIFTIDVKASAEPSKKKKLEEAVLEMFVDMMKDK